MSTDKTLADVQPSFTTGHCQHNSRPGGCQLHNLQCGWPNCDRKAVEPSLAHAQPGGRVRLGDQAELDRLEFQAWARWFVAPVERDEAGDYVSDFTRGLWCAWQAALSAHPSPGGQGDGVRCSKCKDRGYLDVDVDVDDSGSCIGNIETCPHCALAARPPVGQITDAEIDARLNALYREMVDSGQHNGGMSGVAWVRAVFRMASKQPAQAVDLGTGIKAIASERERQLCIEGFSRDSDEQYREGELARAATAYVQLAAMDLQVGSRKHIASQEPPFFWPWAQEWWKPVDARRDLVRAGALIAAQIDLIDSQAVGNK